MQSFDALRPTNSTVYLDAETHKLGHFDAFCRMTDAQQHRLVTLLKLLYDSGYIDDGAPRLTKPFENVSLRELASGAYHMRMQMVLCNVPIPMRDALISATVSPRIMPAVTALLPAVVQRVLGLSVLAEKLMFVLRAIISGDQLRELDAKVNAFGAATLGGHADVCQLGMLLRPWRPYAAGVQLAADDMLAVRQQQQPSSTFSSNWFLRGFDDDDYASQLLSDNTFAWQTLDEVMGRLHALDTFHRKHKMPAWTAMYLLPLYHGNGGGEKTGDVATGRNADWSLLPTWLAEFVDTCVLCTDGATDVLTHTEFVYMFQCFLTRQKGLPWHAVLTDNDAAAHALQYRTLSAMLLAAHNIRTETPGNVGQHRYLQVTWRVQSQSSTGRGESIRDDAKTVRRHLCLHRRENMPADTTVEFVVSYCNEDQALRVKLEHTMLNSVCCTDVAAAKRAVLAASKQRGFITHAKRGTIQVPAADADNVVSLFTQAAALFLVAN